MKRMETQPIDILVMIALDLDTIEVIQLCKTSTRINNSICNNPNFWRSKIEKEYGVNFYLSDVTLLREYYKLLKQSSDNWFDSYLTAYENNYIDLMEVLKQSADIYGTINIDGRFRIHHGSILKDKRGSMGIFCDLYPKVELSFIMEKLRIRINILMSRADYCGQIYTRLKELGLIFTQ